MTPASSSSTSHVAPVADTSDSVAPSSEPTTAEALSTPAATTAAESTTAQAEPSTSLAAVPAEGEGTPRNVAPPVPTPEQWAHLAAVRECLTPKERAIAEYAVVQMSSDPDALAQWLAALSAMSVDDAVRAIRAEIAKRRGHGPKDGG